MTSHTLTTFIAAKLLTDPNAAFGPKEHDPLTLLMDPRIISGSIFFPAPSDSYMGISKKTRLNKQEDCSSPDKGVADLREYKFVNLSNGIEAILVRIPDGQSSKAAVSVAVNAGSMHEPDEFGGLAHFVEHCVFLGNKKFPTRNSLDKLLSKHNGYSNAHTELEYTAYYLEVNCKGLEKAVDILAAAFEAPSFEQELCCAELEAVDSEFHEILNSDDCRIEQMLCVLATEGHQYRKFTWGNKASLLKHGKTRLVSEAQNFFRTHYRPDRMKVSIVSEHSFSKMESLLSMFERIPTCREDEMCPSLSNLNGCTFPLSLSDLPATVFVKPVADIHQLVLLFQLPPILEHYREKPVDFIAHLIGHEAKGSLIHSLREANLSVDISAGVGSEGYSCNAGLSIFEIKLNLTKRGVEKWELILSTFVFPYISQISKTGIVESVYSELAQIAFFQFNHTIEECTKEPIDTAEELAIQMLDHWMIDRSHLLNHDYLYEAFNEPLIRHFLSFLTPQNAVSMLISNSHDHDEWTSREEIFGIFFHKKISNIFSLENTVKFTVPPEPNLFVPSVLNGVPMSGGCKGMEELYVEPSFTIFEEGLRMYCFSKTRSQPSLRCDVRIRFNLSLPPTLASFVQTHLFVAYISDLLEADLYCPKLVGYSVSIAAMPPGKGTASPGIEVCINGFRDKILDLVALIVTAIKGPIRTEPERLSRVFEILRRGFTNEETHPVSTQAVNARKSALSPLSFFRAHSKLDVLISESPVHICMQNIHSLEALVSGSFCESDPNDLKKLIQPLITSKIPSFETIGNIVQTISLETCIVESAHNPEEPTSCLVVYYQFSSEFSVPIAAIADVLSDLMSEAFFDSLRTEEQLGYSVQCGSRYTNGCIGMEFLVQSSSETPEAMVKRIERFIEKFYKSEIKPMTDAEFDSQIEALAESLTEIPTSLGREAKDLWSEITENRCMWDVNVKIREEILGKFLGNKAIIDKLVSDLLVHAKNRRIIVMVNGANAANKIAST